MWRKCLPAQQMEIRGRRRRHCNRHVVLSAHLQVALDAGGRVIWALTFLTVGEKKNDTG